jgi:hypothetical protein
MAKGGSKGRLRSSGEGGLGGSSLSTVAEFVLVLVAAGDEVAVPGGAGTGERAASGATTGMGAREAEAVIAVGGEDVLKARRRAVEIEVSTVARGAIPLGGSAGQD